MQEVLERTRKIRDHINHPWKRELLFRDRVKWDKVCSCMDVLGDTQLAIDSYYNLPEFSAEDGGYLYLYGLLQAFFLQQDSANHLSMALFNKEINWKKDYPDLYLVRELRNDAVGHPTSRNKDKSFHYIARYSIGNKSFKLASYFPKQQKSEHRDFDLLDLKQRHEKSICDLLDKVVMLLEQDLSNHKKKFKNMKLTDLVPNDFYYSVGKVYEGIYNNYPLAELNFGLIKSAYENIKAEIIKRYTSLDALSGVKLLVVKLDYIVSRLDNWIQSKELYQNKDAEVFMDGFDDRFKELEEMLQEIDVEFQN
ncbi:hypothetical protein V1387_08680 [Allomuricauda taeanensis]|uniref:hypothetical protein n=1 Tax=Flagellimonas taeanensis TaxID=1005926 RepID=UPI002E7BF0E0|nr:hypothetical protein [Allomuricauda taeanensis]MEE1962756.1 hypothetical protein [Allomuricauda taeanensis]